MDINRTGGLNDGSNWNNAYKYLQDGLSHPGLTSGDEIWVAGGGYDRDRPGAPDAPTAAVPRAPPSLHDHPATGGAPRVVHRLDDRSAWCKVRTTQLRVCRKLKRHGLTWPDARFRPDQLPILEPAPDLWVGTSGRLIDRRPTAHRRNDGRDMEEAGRCAGAIWEGDAVRLRVGF